jgi:uncharacterized short protein YbdD (DUF466 family)
VIVRLVGVLSHFIYLEDARNHKPKKKWMSSLHEVQEDLKNAVTP